MGYTVTPNDQGEYVHVVHSGTVDPAEILSAREDASRLATEKGWPRFLVDLRDVISPFSTMQHFDLISSTAASAEMHRALIAVVVDTRAAEDFRFAEDLAVNRGLKLKIFIDAGDAAFWLTGG